MAAATYWYGNGALHALDADIDWLADDIFASLHTSSYTPDGDADDFFDDATNECSGTGYTAGGVALASKTRTVVGASNEVQLDAADVEWTGLALAAPARYAVISKRRGGASSADELIGYVDLGGDQSPSTLTIQWPSDGVLKLAYVTP